MKNKYLTTFEWVEWMTLSEDTVKKPSPILDLPRLLEVFRRKFEIKNIDVFVNSFRSRTFGDHVDPPLNHLPQQDLKNHLIPIDLT